MTSIVATKQADRTTSAEKTAPRRRRSEPAISAETVVLRDEVSVPNRALALMERDGNTWRFVRAHLWFEQERRVVRGATFVRSRP